MERRFSSKILVAIGLIVGVSLLLLLSASVWIKTRDVTSGVLTRSVETWIAAPNGSVLVSLRLDGEELPKCTTQQRPLDAVLVIDRSGSMDRNNAVGEAGRAAIAFAQALKESNHRVGLVVFDDSAGILAPLTASLNDLRLAVDDLTAGGGTNIGAGLAVAGAMLAESGTNSIPVIILLSDGGAGDVRDALDQAQELKAQGVHLVVIGLRGDDYDPLLLQQLASSSADVYTVENLPDLSQLYRNLARSLTSIVATDVQVNQPYNAAHFTLAQANLPGSISIGNDILQWLLPVLTEQGAALSYEIIPQSIGWHDVAGREGEIRLTTCAGAASATPLAPGPRVLVLPIPPALLSWLSVRGNLISCLCVGFLLPLALLAFIMFRRRRKGPFVIDSGPGPVEFDFGEKLAPNTSLDEVRPLTYSVPERKDIEFPDALIVGIGESGERILSELRRLIVEHNHGRMPDKVRLLALKARLPHYEEEAMLRPGDAKQNGKALLATEERLELKPDLERVANRLRSGDRSWAHLDWWGDHTPDDPGRAGARMALFYDLMLGEAQSQVWKALGKRLEGLKQPLVYVVASLARPDESGMALDLPHFIKQTADHLGMGTRRVMTLFFLQRTGIVTKEQSDAGRHVYAAIRELQRLLLREPWSFEYNPSIGLVGSTDTTPIDACYLLDGVGPRLDMSEESEEKAFYPTIADALMTLLSPEVVTWHQDYVNQLPELARNVEKRIGFPTVSSFGCSVVQYPMTQLKQVAKFRFLLDLLFGGEGGQEPLGLVRLDPGQDHPAIDARAGLEGLLGRESAIRFLREGGRPNRHPLMRLVAQLVEGETVKEETLQAHAPGNRRIDDAFRYALRDELVVMLNGTGGNTIRNRSGKLGACIAFLSELTKILQDVEYSIPSRLLVKEHIELRQDLTERVISWRRTAENTLETLRHWEMLFVGKGEPPSRRMHRRRRSRQRDAAMPRATLYSRLTSELERSKTALREAATPPLRTFIDWEEEQQESFYQRYLGPKLLDQRDAGLKPLENILARLGWRVQAIPHEDRIDVRLVILPPEESASALEGYAFSYRPDQMEDIWQALLDLASYYLPLLEAEKLDEHLKTMELDRLTEILVLGEKPLLKYHAERISELGVEVQSQLVLTLSDLNWRTRVEEQINRNLGIVSPVEARTSSAAYRCTLLGFTDVIPFSSLEALDEAQLDYTPDALAHIFRAEQQAAKLEREWHTRWGERYRFHPRFVRLLDHESLVKTLTLAHFYGLLTIEPSGIEMRAVLRLPLDHGFEELELVRASRLELFDILHHAYGDWLKAGDEHPLSRKRWADTQVQIARALRDERAKLEDGYAYVEREQDRIYERLEQDKRELAEKHQVHRRRPWLRDVDIYLWLVAEEEKQAFLEDW